MYRAQNQAAGVHRQGAGNNYYDTVTRKHKAKLFTIIISVYPVYGSTWQWDCRPDWRCKCLKEQALDVRIRHQVEGELLLSRGQGELSCTSLSSSTGELELLKGNPDGPSRAQLWGSAQRLLHAIYLLMHLHIFISLRSFSPTLFLLDAATRLKISLKCSLMFFLLNWVCFSKIRLNFPYITAELFFQGSFLTSSPLRHLLHFCTE